MGLYKGPTPSRVPAHVGIRVTIPWVKTLYSVGNDFLPLQESNRAWRAKCRNLHKHETEDYETSLKYYKMTRDTDSQYPSAHKELGRLYIREKKLDETLASLDNAIRFVSHSGMQGHKAKCYQNMGKVQ